MMSAVKGLGPVFECPSFTGASKDDTDCGADVASGVKLAPEGTTTVTLWVTAIELGPELELEFDPQALSAAPAEQSTTTTRSTRTTRLTIRTYLGSPERPHPDGAKQRDNRVRDTRRFLRTHPDLPLALCLEATNRPEHWDQRTGYR